MDLEHQKETSPFTPISELGEFGLIDRLQIILGEPAHPQLLQGIGDDAGVYRINETQAHLITTDALIEHVHFDRTFTPMQGLGFKAISVNVSDIVAMNGRPQYATIALGIPNNASVEMIESLYRGVAHAAQVYDLTIIGGDITAARDLTVSVTVVGEATSEQVVYRSGAKPGDLLGVTGDLGAAYAGLKVLLDEKRTFQEKEGTYQPDLASHETVIQRQMTPIARLDVIKMWQEAGIRPHALIDLSDGLASEVHHICQHSQCGTLIYTATLPIAPATRAVADRFKEDVDRYALFGGEDYELLFALPEKQMRRLQALGVDVVVIGEITQEEAGIIIQSPSGEQGRLEAKGFQHF